MDKISGILPSSSRVAGVDMSEAPPVRPGVPTFGRPVGRSPSTFADRFSVTKTAQERLDRILSPKEKKHVQIARTISDSFFKRQQIEAPKVAVDQYGLDRGYNSQTDHSVNDIGIITPRINYGEPNSMVETVETGSQSHGGVDMASNDLQTENIEPNPQAYWNPKEEMSEIPIGALELSESDVQESIEEQEAEPPVQPDPYAPKGQYLDKSV